METIPPPAAASASKPILSLIADAGTGDTAKGGCTMMRAHKKSEPSLARL